MALPDRFEQVGVLVGCVVLVALPTGALLVALVGFTSDAWWVVPLWLAPGLVVGALLVAGRLPASYHQIWVVSVTSWLLALAGWTALGLADPSANRPVALAVWVVAVGLGVLVARVRPIQRWRAAA